MKKNVILWMSVFTLFFSKNVYAKDTVYSLNKYSEEELNYVISSYKEDKVDGYVVAGTFIKSDKKTFDKQVLLLKYNKSGNIVWEYHYGDKTEDELYGLAYSYDENQKRNGYLLLAKETSEDEEAKAPIFLRISEIGKEMESKTTSLDPNTKIETIKELDQSGYLVTGKRGDTGFVAKYNNNLELVWIKDYLVDSIATNITDIIEVGESIYAIATIEREETSYQLIKMDLEGTIEKILKEDFEKTIPPKLLKEKDSYVVYGITNEVKLSEDSESSSFYLMKMSIEDTEVWETVGNIPVDETKVIQIQNIVIDEESKEYLILATNKSDGSIEVTRIDSEGVIRNKVKKLKNNYYHINGFLSQNNTIYFIGQINCPEDDNCDYDENSLFLVSDEDKVIEVKDNDSKTILFVTTLFILGTIGLYIIRKKRKLESKGKKK